MGGAGFRDFMEAAKTYRWVMMVVALLFVAGYTINVYSAASGGLPRVDSGELGDLSRYVEVYYINQKMFPTTVESTEGAVTVPVKGKVNIVTPQYVRCPDICHMETTIMLYVAERLGEEGLLDEVVFVTVDVDPWEGSLEAAESYMETQMSRASYKPNWVWLFDSLDRMERIYKQLGLTVQRDPETGLVVHTGGFYIVTDKGTLLYYIRITDEGWRSLDKAGEALYSIVKTILKGERLPAEMVRVDLP